MIDLGPITLAWYELAVVWLSTLALAGLGGAALRSPDPELVEGTLDVDDLPDDPAGYVDLPAPAIATSRFGIFGTLYALYRHHIRRRRLARKGYVQWFRVENGTLSGPHYVRPETGPDTKIPQIEHDGGEYLFPSDAMVPETRSGMWTVIHREGEGTPINLRDADEFAIPAEAAKEWSDMQVTASEPGWLSGLGDMSPQMIIAISIGLTVLIAVIAGQFG